MNFVSGRCYELKEYPYNRLPKAESSAEHIKAARCVNYMDRCLNEIAEKEKRIGVFGSYEAEDVIAGLCEAVSSIGYVAITGNGYLEPFRKFESFRRFTWPHQIRWWKSTVIDPILYMHFPKLTFKSIFYLNIIGGQVFEAYGCYMFRIPRLGLIISQKPVEDVYNDLESQRCNNIRFNNNGNISYLECLCDGKLCCQSEALNLSCPFAGTEGKLSWSIRQLFIDGENRLIMVSDLNTAKRIVKAYITNSLPRKTFNIGIVRGEL